MAGVTQVRIVRSGRALLDEGPAYKVGNKLIQADPKTEQIVISRQDIPGLQIDERGDVAVEATSLPWLADYMSAFIAEALLAELPDEPETPSKSEEVGKTDDASDQADLQKTATVEEDVETDVDKTSETTNPVEDKDDKPVADNPGHNPGSDDEEKKKAEAPDKSGGNPGNPGNPGSGPDPRSVDCGPCPNDPDKHALHREGESCPDAKKRVCEK
jgi:hypothetical protein